MLCAPTKPLCAFAASALLRSSLRPCLPLTPHRQLNAARAMSTAVSVPEKRRRQAHVAAAWWLTSPPLGLTHLSSCLMICNHISPHPPQAPRQSTPRQPCLAALLFRGRVALACLHPTGLPACLPTPQQPAAAGAAAAAKARTALDEMGAKGEFQRKESVYRSWIKKGGEYEPEGERAAVHASSLCFVVFTPMSELLR